MRTLKHLTFKMLSPVFPDRFVINLTTASLSGSWVPDLSRNFHYWQPAPRLRPLPWLANPGKPAMSPQALEGGQAPVTLMNSGKRGEGREGKKQKLPGAKNHHANAWLTAKTTYDL